MINQWLGAWEEWHEEIEEMRDLGSRVYVVATQHGRGKGSGAEVAERYALIYEIKAGTIIRLTLYSDLAEALEATGLRE
jgi:ketosteroid isomerase-like protein